MGVARILILRKGTGRAPRGGVGVSPSVIIIFKFLYQNGELCILGSYVVTVYKLGACFTRIGSTYGIEFCETVSSCRLLQLFPDVYIFVAYRVVVILINRIPMNAPAFVMHPYLFS